MLAESLNILRSFPSKEEMNSARLVPGSLWIVRLAEQISRLAARQVRTWPAPDKDRIGDQLMRAADSIGLNISEGYARIHLKERQNFLSIARGSLEEALFAVRRARDRELMSRLDASILSGLLIKLGRALNHFTTALDK